MIAVQSSDSLVLASARARSRRASASRSPTSCTPATKGLTIPRLTKSSYGVDLLSQQRDPRRRHHPGDEGLLVPEPLLELLRGHDDVIDLSPEEILDLLDVPRDGLVVHIPHQEQIHIARRALAAGGARPEDQPLSPF